MSWDDVVPIHAEGIALDDIGIIADGKINKIGAKVGADLLIAEVLHEEHGDFGDLAGEVFDFDAIELVKTDAGMVGVEIGLEVAVEELEDFEFELTQAVVGDDEEVATATGGIEKGEGGNFVEESFELGRGTGGAFEFGFELIEKEGPDDFENVFFGGVVSAKLAALLGVHDTLEHSTKDGRADESPIEIATIEKDSAHFCVEGDRGKGFTEKAAIYIAEAVESF